MWMFFDNIFLLFTDLDVTRSNSLLFNAFNVVTIMAYSSSQFSSSYWKERLKVSNSHSIFLLTTIECGYQMHCCNQSVQQYQWIGFGWAWTGFVVFN